MTDSTDLQTDALSNQDLEGISGAVAKGILRAAIEQDRDQDRRRRITGAGYMIALMILVGLFTWGWTHRPAQTVVLNARFLVDTKLTAVLSKDKSPSSQQESFLLLLNGVEHFSRLQGLLLPVELILPLDGDAFQESESNIDEGSIDRLDFEISGEDSAENENRAAPISVLVSATEVQQVTLRRPSKNDPGITRINVQTVADQSSQAKVRIEALEELDRKVAITDADGTTSVLMGKESRTLKLPQSPVPSSVPGDSLVSSSFDAHTVSESPGIRFDARVSKLVLSGTEGFFDIGQTRVPLVSNDTLELMLLEDRSIGVEINDGKISLGSAAVATSVKLGESELLPRKIEASPIFRTFVTALGAALLGLFSSVLPALASLISFIFKERPFGAR
ncbi:MAG: hypothetical protein IIA92_06430 [Chloroflexi bacterium]|nr:hypothetical protein [Chloroflexota bacterium]